MGRHKVLKFLHTGTAVQLLAWAGILVFLGVALINTVQLPPILDESAYLFDGYLFVTGRFAPFEAGGPYMSKMPLVYYLYGLAQLVFGPTLAVGRLTAVTFGVLSLVGLQQTLRRLVRPWVVTLGVWLVVFSPNMIRNFSQVFSQVMVACALIWSLYFLLDPHQRQRSTLMGGFLAVVVVLLRQNMVFYPFLAALYVFSTSQKKTAWINLLLMAGVFSGFHALFFPNILQLWAAHLPFGRSFFIRIGILPPPSSNAMVQALSLESRLRALHEALMFSGAQISALAFAFMGLKWEIKKWRPNRLAKTLVFLSLSWVSLAWIHADASIGGNYCVFCFRMYLDFFSYLLIVLICILVDQAASQRQAAMPDYRFKSRGWLVLYMAIFAAGVGISLNMLEFPAKLLSTMVPRFSQGRLYADTTQFYTYIHSLLRLEYEQAIKLTQWLLPLLLFLLLLALGLVVYKFIKRTFAQQLPARLLMPGLLMLLVFIFSYHPVFNIGFKAQNCGNVLQNESAMTATLQALLQDGDEISWHGNYGIHTIAGVIEEIIFHPPQINSLYTRMNSEMTSDLLDFGLYNQELEEQWLNDADLVVVQQAAIYAELNERLRNDPAFQAPQTLPAFCVSLPDSVFSAYQRKK